MYLDEIFDLSKYANKRFVEPSIKVGKKKYEMLCYEKYIAEDILLKLLDKPEENPIDIISESIDMYEIRRNKADKDVIKNMYASYIRTLIILKQYLLKKYK